MGNPAIAPPLAIANLLNGQTVGGVALVLGTNLFAGPERPKSQGIPSQAVFCCEYGGPPPSPYLGQDQDDRSFVVQVIFRGKPGDLNGARALANGGFPLLQRAVSAGYIDVRCNESGPHYLGRTPTDEPRFSLNTTLRFQG